MFNTFDSLCNLVFVDIVNWFRMASWKHPNTGRWANNWDPAEAAVSWSARVAFDVVQTVATQKRAAVVITTIKGPLCDNTN